MGLTTHHLLLLRYALGQWDSGVTSWPLLTS